MVKCSKIWKFQNVDQILNIMCVIFFLIVKRVKVKKDPRWSWLILFMYIYVMFYSYIMKKIYIKYDILIKYQNSHKFILILTNLFFFSIVKHIPNELLRVGAIKQRSIPKQQPVCLVHLSYFCKSTGNIDNYGIKLQRTSSRIIEILLGFFL